MNNNYGKADHSMHKQKGAAAIRYVFAIDLGISESLNSLSADRVPGPVCCLVECTNQTKAGYSTVCMPKLLV